MKLVLITLTTLITSTNQLHINYTDCGQGEIIYIKSDYAIFEPYQLAPGTTFDLEVKFIPQHSAEKPKMTVFVEGRYEGR